MTKIKFHPVALGLSTGIISGASLFAMGLLAHLFLFGKPLVAAIGTMYVTYDPSFIGAVIGGLVGFINGFIGGYILAWLYNLLLEYF